jgi:transcriptional regulator with XRE-family HTH domain
MDINERVRMIINSQNLTASAFADKIGVQRSNVSHVLSGRNKPSFEFIEKLLNAFPNVSSDWLILGKTQDKSINKIEEPEAVKEVVQLVETNKKVVKIMVFYDDFSIDTFNKEVN